MSVPHTPGPWARGSEHRTMIHTVKEGIGICDVYPARHVWEANARLIAAAPDLEEALKAIFKMVDHEVYAEDIDRTELLEIARKALVKAGIDCEITPDAGRGR